jgi:membrane-associated phospholipid phosphatase
MSATSKKSRRGRLLASALLVLAAVSLAVSGAAARADGPGGVPAAAPGAATVDPVIAWNRELLGILGTAGAQPATIHATRSLAILHAAMYDAVDSIERTSLPYVVSIVSPRRADPTAAAAAAGYAVLTSLYPSQQEPLASEFQSLLGTVPEGYHKYEGVRAGEAVADALLALRADDGSSLPQPGFTPGTQPGEYQPTPPAFAQPAFQQWPDVRLFVLRTASQFRPGPPPALSSTAYAAAFAEVKSLGAANSATRTADQTQIAQFWNQPIWIAWNNIAETAALAHHNTLMQDARLFALLNLTFADSTVAFYDAKYAYRFWRPVTAIEAADTGNPALTGDPGWTPLANTAQDPSYPGAHAVISAAAAAVLGSVFGGDSFSFAAQSSALPGVQRSFTSFSAAAQEATLSRIYAGQHFRTDEDAGQTLGSRVAGYVLQHALQPLRTEKSA